MAWEFAAIVRKDGDQIHHDINDRTVKEYLLKWVLVSPGKNPNPPRIKFELRNRKPEKSWVSPINKPYWAFTDHDDKEFNKQITDRLKSMTPAEHALAALKASSDGKGKNAMAKLSETFDLSERLGKNSKQIKGCGSYSVDFARLHKDLVLRNIDDYDD